MLRWSEKFFIFNHICLSRISLCNNLIIKLYIIENRRKRLTNCPRWFWLQEAYRKWVCSSLVPYFAHRSLKDVMKISEGSWVRLRPCRSFCQTVEERCPYFLPGDRAPAYPTQYAGEPTFLCRGKKNKTKKRKRKREKQDVNQKERNNYCRS